MTMRMIVIIALAMLAGCGTYTGQNTPDNSVVMECTAFKQKACERRGGRLTRCWCQDRNT